MSSEFITDLSDNIDANIPVIIICASDPAYAIYEVDKQAERKKRNLCIWREDKEFHPKDDFKYYNQNHLENHTGCRTKKIEEKHPYPALSADAASKYQLTHISRLKSAGDVDDAITWLHGTPLESFIMCIDLHNYAYLGFTSIQSRIQQISQNISSHKQLILILNSNDICKNDDEEGESDNNNAMAKLKGFEEFGVFLTSNSPSRSYLRKQFCDVLKSLQKPLPSKNIIDTIIRASIGLTGQQMRVLTRRIAYKYDLASPKVVQMIYDERFRINCPKALKYVQSGMNVPNVGGLTKLKEWIGVHKNLYSKEARNFGIDSPKGILLIGPPGTGKSIAPAYIARMLNLPMFYFHPEECMSKYVSIGETKCRKTFEAIDQLPPCIIYLDEVEKFFANVDDATAHESTQRLFGLWIEWLSSRKSKAIVVASSNRLTNLPPELSRPGRFDQIFYVGLPNFSSREEIFHIHLKSRHHGDTFSKEEICKFARLTESYSAAEIEQVVKNAILKAYLRDKVLRPEDVTQGIMEITPLSKSREDEIYNLCVAGMKLGTPAGELSELEKNITDYGATNTSYQEWNPSYC